MRAFFYDPSFIQYDNPIRMTDCGKAVCRNKRRLSLALQADMMKNPAFCPRIDSRQRIIKQQNFGINEQRPRNR